MDANQKILLMVEDSGLRDALAGGLADFTCRFLPSDENNTIERIFDEVPHLVVIDEDFKRGQGPAIALQIKEDLVLQYIPIMLLVKKDSEVVRSEGVDHYQPKSSGTEGIVQAVCRALEQNYNELDLNPLTKLPGSRSSVLRIERAIQTQRIFAILCLDLANLAVYNKAYGDARGDEVISALSKIIQEVLKKEGSSEDFVGHPGGDDFIIVTGYDNAVAIAESIIRYFDAQIQNYYDLEDRARGYILQKDHNGSLKRYPLMSVSIVVVHNENSPLGEISEVSRIAGDLKKYTKTLPGSCYVKYRHRPQTDPDRRYEEALEVRFPGKMKSVKVSTPIEDTDKYMVFFNAILRGQKIESVYQPIVDLAAKRIHGYEALTRSRVENLASEPAMLFSIARDSGKIKELDKLCVDCALRSAQQLSGDKKLFINLNLETLIDPIVMKGLFEKRAQIGFKNIVIEVTEQSILRSFEKVREALLELKEQGVSVAIDDVGGGAVSLRDVAVLRPNYIKFDRSLIRQIDTNHTKQQIVLSMILFANGIKAITTAEGIETKEEYEAVKSLGVSLAQGYYFARPGPPFPEVSEFL